MMQMCEEDLDRLHRNLDVIVAKKHVRPFSSYRMRVFRQLCDLGFTDGVTDNVRLRALEKILDFLDGLDDEKQQGTSGEFTDLLETSVRLLEAVLDDRREAGNTTALCNEPGVVVQPA